MSMSTVLCLADAACTLYIFNCDIILIVSRNFARPCSCCLITGGRAAWCRMPGSHTSETAPSFLGGICVLCYTPHLNFTCSCRLENEQNELVEIIETVTYQICRDDDIDVDIFYEVRIHRLCRVWDIYMLILCHVSCPNQPRKCKIQHKYDYFDFKTVTRFGVLEECCRDYWLASTKIKMQSTLWRSSWLSSSAWRAKCESLLTFISDHVLPGVSLLQPGRVPDQREYPVAGAGVQG